MLLRIAFRSTRAFQPRPYPQRLYTSSIRTLEHSSTIISYPVTPRPQSRRYPGPNHPFQSFEATQSPPHQHLIRSSPDCRRPVNQYRHKGPHLRQRRHRLRRRLHCSPHPRTPRCATHPPIHIRPPSPTNLNPTPPLTFTL